MYTQFYGLREKPFSLSPDPRFLFLSDAHREALAHLLYGIEQGEGFIVITGEVGTGKTTLCRTLLRRLEPGTEVAFIFNPQLSGLELLQVICAELGLETAERSRRELTERLNRFLLRKRSEGRRVLLIVDEAQTLEPEGLEQVRLLSNLETDTEKLLQIVLIGQPELDGTLESPGLRQLRQRIGVRWRLLPLSQAETRAYVRHRLRIAAGAHRDLFTEPALREVHRRSGGIPRLVNLLCDRALLAGYASAAPSIGLGLVAQAEEELRGDGAPRPAARRASLERPRMQAWRRWAPVVAGFAGALAGVWVARALLAPEGRTTDAGPPAVSSAPAPPVSTAPAPSPPAVPAPPSSGAARSPLSDPPGGATPPVSSAPPPGPALQPASGLDAAASGLAELPSGASAPGFDQVLAAQPADETRGRAVEAALRAWEQEPPAELLAQRSLSLPQAVGMLRAQGFSVMHLVGARVEDLQEIDRPALLALEEPGGAAQHVLLRHIDGDEAVVSGARSGSVRVSLDSLRARWAGEAWIPWRDYRELPESLGPGAEGEAVRWLQEELAARGIYRGPESGRFDEATRAAVVELQADQRLEMDGRVGPVTKLRLYEREAGLREPRLRGAG